MSILQKALERLLSDNYLNKHLKIHGTVRVAVPPEMSDVCLRLEALDKPQRFVADTVEFRLGFVKGDPKPRPVVLGRIEPSGDWEVMES